MRNRRKTTAHKATASETQNDPMRILKRGEVATLLGVSTIRIDQLSRSAEGPLRKVRLPGVSRAVGFVASEVYELLTKRQTGGAA